MSAIPEWLADPAAAAERHRRRCAAYQHWLAIGFSAPTARELARARWDVDPDTRARALAYVTARTNMREQDLV